MIGSAPYKKDEVVAPNGDGSYGNASNSSLPSIALNTGNQYLLGKIKHLCTWHIEKIRNHICWTYFVAHDLSNS